MQLKYYADTPGMTSNLIEIVIYLTNNDFKDYYVTLVFYWSQKMTSELLDKTVDLLEQDRGNWNHTAKVTGLGRDWIAKLAQGHINDPGVKKIEKLHDYLTEKYQAA